MLVDEQIVRRDGDRWVLTVEPDERGLFQYAELEPAVDFGRLDTVFIITGKKAPEALEPATPAASPSPSP